MESDVLGRNNVVLPAKWLRLVAPDQQQIDVASLARAAEDAQTVIDISTNPALWGGCLRGIDATLMTVGPLDLAHAVDEQQAHDLVLAHLLETMSAMGREMIDFYFLRVDRPLKEFQISGALIALQEAREEESVKYVGLAAIDVLTAQTLLHFHDVFEAMLIRDQEAPVALRSIAKARRITLVTLAEAEVEARDGEAILVPVSSAQEVELMTKQAVRR